jgi:DHA2 family multidrug resistance protein
MPIAGILMKKGLRPGYLIAVGLCLASFALAMMSNFNLQADFFSISVPRFTQGLGLGLFFVPLAGAAFINISPERIGNASGVFNLVRNLGGSFGTAFSTTLLAERSQFHQTFLSENITIYNPAFREAYKHAYSLFGANQSAAAPSAAGLAYFYQEVLRQASMLSFNDAFHILSIATALLIPLAFLLNRRRAGAPPSQGIAAH